MVVRKSLGFVIALAALVSLTNCTHGHKSEAPSGPTVGGDRDVHGCIPSAGYAWCTREKACVRPWELAKAKDFANTPDAVRAYCDR